MLIHHKFLLGILLSCGVAGVAEAAPAKPKATASAKPHKTETQRAKALCDYVKSGPDYKKAVRAANRAARRDADRIADQVCDFFAAPPRGEAKAWQETIDLAVARNRISTRDGQSLSTALRRPKAFLATWSPQTDLAIVIKQNVQDQGDATESASTAGSVGTIIGALIGGLGGTPASVGLGAAIGKVIGEGADALGNYFYEIAPDPEEEGDGGDEDGDE